MLYNNITTVYGYNIELDVIAKCLLTDMPKNEFEQGGDHLGLYYFIRKF